LTTLEDLKPYLRYTVEADLGRRRDTVRWGNDDDGQVNTPGVPFVQRMLADALTGEGGWESCGLARRTAHVIAHVFGTISRFFDANEKHARLRPATLP
jgi:hypothetical protein